MKTSFKYGLNLGLVFILHTVVFYFVNPNLMFEVLGNVAYWYLFLYIIFMLMAIYETRHQTLDRGVYFRMTLLLYIIASTISAGFEDIFFNCFADELNPYYIEERKKWISRDFFGIESPLTIFEEVELYDGTIEKDRTFTGFLGGSFLALFLFGIPLSALISLLGKWMLKKM